MRVGSGSAGNVNLETRGVCSLHTRWQLCRLIGVNILWVLKKSRRLAG
jgi:hypothetical protein